MKACGRVCGACLGVVPITATVLSQTRTITQLYLTAGEAGERGCVRAPKDEECTDFADLSAVGHKSLLESRLHIHICGFHSLCFVREGSFVSFYKTKNWDSRSSPKVMWLFIGRVQTPAWLGFIPGPRSFFPSYHTPCYHELTGHSWSPWIRSNPRK